MKISLTENYHEENDKCPECKGKLIINSFEKICKECGLVINNFFKESTFIFNDLRLYIKLKD